MARVARQRLGETGYVVGVDISPDMLAVARAVEPAIDWREGNASGLPLRDGEQFDVVVCQQGLQFFPDKPAAAAQMRRALAKGGRLAVATWRPDDEIPLFGSCAASRSAIWAPSPISGTALETRPRLRRYCETAVSTRSDQGSFRAPSISGKARPSCG
jgi:ubiquinone/menaquinone biosynthesis C-methylase UbiE